METAAAAVGKPPVRATTATRMGVVAMVMTLVMEARAMLRCT